MDLAKQIRDQKTILLPVDSLKPYEKNARTHSKAQVDKLAKMISINGFLGSILINNEKDRRLIVGHGRLMAAKALGLTELPCTTADHLTEAQIKAHCIADNQIALDAGWDMDLLKDELSWLDSKDYDLSLTGFDEDTLEGLLVAADPENELHGDPDSIPDSAPTRCQPGDVWSLGRHRLKCGDSTNIQHVEELMGGVKATLCITDPPYNVNYGAEKIPGGWSSRKDRTIMNDYMPADEFRDFCRGFVGSIAASVDGCIYVFGPPGQDGRIMFTVLDEALHCSTTIVWNKDRFVLGRGKYHNKYEPCWFGWNGSGTNFIDDRTLTNVWDFPRPTASDLHPTMKPVALIEQAMSHASKPGDLVLDLFGGSGTTLIAAEKCGRKAHLMELDPKYCDVILKRWEDLTGGTAERVISELP